MNRIRLFRHAPRHNPRQGHRNSSQAGQAMTEFVVSVAFVFLVIFVAVPTFGKIMDLQFQNLQAARYIAWERTVWFDQIDDDNRDDFNTDGGEFQNAAQRSDEAILNSAINRFFLGHGQMEPSLLTQADVDRPDGEGSPVWTYVESDNGMYGGTTLAPSSFDAQDTPSVAYDIVGVLGTGIKAVKEPIDFMLGAIGNENEDLFELPLMTNDKTYYNPVLRTKINIAGAHGEGTSTWDRDASGRFTPGIESAFFQSWDGVLQTPAAILADGWNAQSTDYYKDRVDDYVPSSLFDNALFDGLITAASILEGGPANSAIGKLEMGYVGIEPMPTRLGQPSQVICEVGYCSFE